MDDIETITAEVRYKRAALQYEQQQRARLLCSTIVIDLTEQPNDNAELIELFDVLKKAKATRNKPASDERDGGMTLVFHPSRLDGSMDVFTFIGTVKITRESMQPLKFIIFGMCEDGRELWLTVTYRKKRYTRTHVSYCTPGTDPRSKIGESEVSLIRRSSGGVRPRRRMNGHE